VKGLWKKARKSYSFFPFFYRKSIKKYLYFRLKKRWFALAKTKKVPIKLILRAYRRRLPPKKKSRRRLFINLRRVWLKRPAHYYKALSRPMRFPLLINYGRAVFAAKAAKRLAKASYYDFFLERAFDYTGRRRLMRKFAKFRPRAYF
jgi:hypothetical protein